MGWRWRCWCEEAGFAFSGKGKRYSCAGTPVGVGMEAEVKLGFCEGELCRVVLKGNLDQDDGKLWEKTFIELQRALTKRYGEPTRRNVQWPGPCREDDTVVPCLVEGRAKLRLDWVWPRSAGIVLVMAADQKQTDQASLRLTYSSKQVSKTGSTGGL